MNYAINALVKYIPPENVGYTFIKRTEVFIPYKQIGISILERTETALSFVYETVLSCLSEGLTDVEDIAKLLGLEFDIFKEILAEMAMADLLVVTEMSLILTVKGKQALKELKKVEIKKSQLNEIYINLITGDVQNQGNKRFYDRLTPGYMYLDQNYGLDIVFLRDRLFKIEKIFNEQKKEETIFLTKSRENKSLYRILDIAYENLKYVAISCFVYMNELDSSIMLIFDDEESLIYAATANSQIINNEIGASLLFESNRELIKPYESSEYDNEKSAALNNLVDAIQQREKATIPLEEIENLYYKDRYLLDGEVKDILTSSNLFKTRELIIASPRLKNFLQDNSTLDYLISVLSTTTIMFIYNNDEYGIEKSKQWVLSKISSEKSKRNIKFYAVPAEHKITITQIVCKHGFIINSLYQLIKDVTSHYLLKEISDISFDDTKVQRGYEQLTKVIDKLSKVNS